MNLRLDLREDHFFLYFERSFFLEIDSLKSQLHRHMKYSNTIFGYKNCHKRFCNE